MKITNDELFVWRNAKIRCLKYGYIFEITKYQIDHGYPKKCKSKNKYKECLNDNLFELIDEGTYEFSYVYIIQNTKTGYIKIGRSENPRERLKTLQTSNSSRLIILCILSGGKLRERILHKRFCKDNVRGEWFYPSNELIRYIRNITNKGFIRMTREYGLKMYIDEEDEFDNINIDKFLNLI